MKHQHYFEVNARSNYNLGFQEGVLFREQAQQAYGQKSKNPTWKKNVKNALSHLPETEQAFPHYLDELKGYARGAQIPFEALWTISIEEELGQENRCTTIITNNGSLIAHNEDAEKGAEESICILKKTLPHISIFELFYYNTLGGNSISVNSNGYIHAVNTLTSSDMRKTGIPRNVIARWLSETASPETGYQKLCTFHRSSGYCHTLTHTSGTVYTLESSATKQSISQAPTPYIHTNHYLGNLKKLEANDHKTGTKNRYNTAKENAKPIMTVNEVTQLIANQSAGKKYSIFNERTIARTVIDLKSKMISIWLAREKDKNWIEYPLL